MALFYTNYRRSQAHYVFLLSLLLFLSCFAAFEQEDPELSKTVESDEVVAAIFGSTETTASDWTLGKNPQQVTIKFDKRDYPEATFIIFKGEIFSTRQDTRCFARLYNLTDDVPIRESEISGFFELKTSNNLLPELPGKEILLGIQIKSETTGVSVGVWNHSFILAGKE